MRVCSSSVCFRRVDELRSLDRQIKQITALLRTWNKTFESAPKIEKKDEAVVPVVNDVLHTS